MSLLWIDGFDVYGPDNASIMVALEEAGYGVSAGFGGLPNSSAFANTRTGIGFSVSPVCNVQGGYISRNFQTAAGIVTGFAVQLQTSEFTTICTLGYNNYIGGGARQLILYANGANGLTMQTGDGLGVYVSKPNVLFTGVWQYVEVKYAPGSTTSYLEVRVDGVTVLRVTNQNLVSAGQAGLVNYMRLNGDGNQKLYIDDWYLCDTNGTSFNDFLGDCVVHALLPKSDAGMNQFAQVGGNGAGHFTSVNELATDGDVSYLSSNTAGQTELFTVPTLPSDIVDVLAVAVNITARKQAPGLGTFVPVLEAGGIEQDGAPIATSLNYVTQQALFPLAPGGGNWTLSLAQNAQFGVKII